MPLYLEVIKESAFKNTKIVFINIPENVTTIEAGAFSASSDNNYGGYLFVKFEANKALTFNVVQGFEKNDKTYLFVRNNVDNALHDYDKYMDPSKSELYASAFETDKNFSAYWWYYVYEYADLLDYTDTYYSAQDYHEYNFRFVRVRSTGYELALVIGMTTNASYAPKNSTYANRYDYLLPTTLNGKNVNALGNRVYAHSGITSITKLGFAEKTLYTKVGDEAFRVIKYASNAYTYQTVSLACNNTTTFFSIGNVSTIGNYAFAKMAFATATTFSFPNNVLINDGAFACLTNNNVTLNFSFTGAGTINDYAFYKGNGTGKITSLQLGSVDSIGAYAFYGDTITNIPYRISSFDGMSKIGDYAFGSTTIGTSGATSYNKENSSMLYLDVSLKEGVDIADSNIFNSAKFFGAVLKINNIPLIDTTIFASSNFTACLVNVDYADKIVTEAFLNSFKATGTVYCDISALNVPTIGAGAFVSQYIGNVYVGLNDPDLMAINNKKENEDYSWGGNYKYVSDGDVWRCGIIVPAASLSSGTVKGLYIDGDIPYNSAYYVFAPMHRTGIGKSVTWWTSSITYGVVDFTDKFHGEIPAYAFAERYCPELCISIYQYGNGGRTIINNLKLGKNATGIGAFAFAGAYRGYRDVQIDNTEMSFENLDIKSDAFLYATFSNLSSMTLTSSTKITAGFECAQFSSLKTLKIEAGADVGTYSFSNALFSKIEKLIVEDGATINSYLFHYATFSTLNTLTLGDNVNIGSYAFNYSTIKGLSTLTFGDNVNIGSYAFNYSDIYGLTTLTIPDNTVVNSYAFNYTDFFALTNLTFEASASLGQQSFYYANLPMLQKMTFKPGSVIPNLMFHYAKIGTSYDGNVEIDMHEAESVGYGAFARMTLRSYTATGGFNLNAQNVGKISPHAFGGCYWNNVYIGLTKTELITDTDNYWGGYIYYEYGGIFTGYCPSDNRGGTYCNNGGDAYYSRINYLYINGEFPINSATKCLSAYNDGRATKRVYYNNVIVNNCSKIPDYAFYDTSTDRTDTYIYNLEISSNTEVGANVFAYNYIMDSDITYDYIVDKYNAEKLAVNAFYYARLVDNPDTNGLVKITKNIPDKLFIGVSLNNSAATKLELAENITIGQYSFQSASFPYVTEITFNKNTINSYGFTSASFAKLANLSFDDITIGNNAFQSASFASAKNAVFDGSIVGDSSFISTSFASLDVLEIKNNVTLSIRSFAQMNAPLLSKLNIGEGMDIPKFCFFNAMLGYSASKSCVINLDKVAAIRYCSFSSVNTTNIAYGVAYDVTKKYPIVNAKDVGIIEKNAFCNAHWGKVTIGLSDGNQNSSYCWGGSISNAYASGGKKDYGIFALIDVNDDRGGFTNFCNSQPTRTLEKFVDELVIDGSFPLNSNPYCLGIAYASGHYSIYNYLHYRNVVIKNCDYLPEYTFASESGSQFQLKIDKLTIDSSCDALLGKNAFAYIYTDMSTWDLTGVTEIGEYSLANIRRISTSYPLATLSFPKLISISGNNAFLNNACIESLEFGENCTSIYGGDDFKDMTNLKTIILKRIDKDSSTPITVLANPIPTASLPSSLTKIKVSSKAITAYREATNWSIYSSLFDYYLASYTDAHGNVYTCIVNGEDTATLEGLTSSATGDTIEIPVTIDIEGETYTVTELEEGLLDTEAGQTIVSITIPSNILNIDPKLFNNTTSVSTIIVDASNPNYKSSDDNQSLLSIDGSTLYRVMPNASFDSNIYRTSDYSGLVAIYTNAFTNCLNIDNLIIGGDIAYLGENITFNSSINTITFEGDAPPVLLGSNSLGSAIEIEFINFIATYNVLPSYHIYVPTGKADIYKNSPGYYKYKSIIEEVQ